MEKEQKWCVIHWLAGSVKMIGSKKECLDYSKKNSPNPKAPIYYAVPVAGVQVIVHEHIHTHQERAPKVKRKKTNH